MTIYDYYQPSFYHFSQDSLLLKSFTLKYLKDKRIESVIDIGAGCGVIGFEIARGIESVQQLDFLELQKEFFPCLEKNKAFCRENVSIDLYQERFSRFESSKKYDLVISNPPYFNAGKGRSSENELKQVCRTFEKDNLTIMLSKMRELKKDNGVGLFLMRNDQESIEKEVKKNSCFEVFKEKKISIYRLT